LTTASPAPVVSGVNAPEEAPAPLPNAVTRVRELRTRFFAYLSTREGASWVAAVVIAAAVSIGLAFELLQTTIPAGGDPGTWLSTSYVYIGRPFPSQVYPFAYPPVMFPLLGIAVVVAGGPIGGVQLFAPTLYFVVALTTFYLATQMLRSRLVALVVMSFIILDPQLLQMVFWGAYPNLMGFVFMNLSLVGLLCMGKGSLSKGALMFWVCGALTVLTHSLTGLVLAGYVFFFLLLTWAAPRLSPAAQAANVAAGEVDVPKKIPKALFLSRGGRYGIVGFAIAVGAYYILTALAKVPHPNYFVSSALAFRVIGLGGVLTAVLPGLLIVALGAVYVLSVLVIVVLLVYASFYLYRPSYLTTPVLLLIAIGITVLSVPIVGWMFKIVTDYRRFGYFLLIPLGLTLGYLIDHGWAASRLGPATRAAPGAPGPRLPRTVRRWLRPARHPRRIVTLAVVSVIVGLLLVSGITIPWMGKYETTFTRVGHDQYFLDALDAIKASGQPGGILTVAGADKWAKAITDRNAYAPYTQTDYLFFEDQVLDSELAYYALNFHYAVTNGLVSAELKGVTPPYVLGIPSYGVYSVGTFRNILKIPPQLVEVELVAPNGTTSETNLSVAAPTVNVPPAGGGGAMQIVFTESEFVFSVDLVVAPDAPYLYMTFHLQATGADRVRALTLALVPSNTTSARILPTITPGNFSWDTITANVGPLTLGNVTPASALAAITPYLPLTNLTGTPAVVLNYTSPTSSGGLAITGQLTLTTPAASTIFNVVPPVVVTPQVWDELGIRFVLMRNWTYPPLPAASVAYPHETTYLEAEYGATLYYQNPEWSVMLVPDST
jgi:hypothetical protein